MQNKTIRLSLERIHGKQCLALRHPYDKAFIEAARELGASWSPHLKAWYIEKEWSLKYLKNYFSPRFSIDDRSLPLEVRLRHVLSQDHMKLVADFTMYLEGSRYSPATISVYRNWIMEFLCFNRNKPAGNLTLNDVHRFNHEVILERNYSVSSQRQFIGALKLFFTHTCPGGPNPDDLERPRKDQRLPEVLSKQEIQRILTFTKNLKHKLILSLLYSCGLRVGELIRLRLSDIEKERQMVRISMSKGRKDRYVPLGRAVQIVLYNYLKKYTSSFHVIEGPNGRKYSTSSIRKILKRACKAAGIQKKVTPHTLRHSYATHMLELGVDIRYIQAMLGHRRPETTMIYTHISSQKIENLPNPLDELVREQQKSFPDKRNNISSKLPIIPKKLWGY